VSDAPSGHKLPSALKFGVTETADERFRTARLWANRVCGSTSRRLAVSCSGSGFQHATGELTTLLTQKAKQDMARALTIARERGIHINVRRYRNNLRGKGVPSPPQPRGSCRALGRAAEAPSEPSGSADSEGARRTRVRAANTAAVPTSCSAVRRLAAAERDVSAKRKAEGSAQVARGGRRPTKSSRSR